MSVILGIETSGLEGRIALRRDGQLVAEVVLDRTRRRHAQTLIAEVQQVLRAHATSPTDVDVVAVSRGPGSFTGLRVGIVFAKTFAYATGCRLVAVDTLQAISSAAPQDILQVSAVADAMRDELFVGDYRRHEDGNWRRVGEISIRPFEEWSAAIATSVANSFAISGPGLTKFVAELPPQVRVIPESDWSPSAALIAEIGERQALLGDIADPVTLEPFYLRKSAAEEKRDASPS